MVTPVEKRKAVGHLCKEHGVSQRRACNVLSVDRSSVRYRSIRPDDADVRKAMKEVAAERRRFGYRRIHIMLERQGIYMNQKKLRRLYREEGLQVRKRGGRKRALGTRHPMIVPETINQRWSLDFVSDAFTDGRRFRVLAVVDDFSRECLALVPDTSLSGARLTRELDAIFEVRGMPKTIISELPAERHWSERQWQRDGNDQFSGSELVPENENRLALHRTGQANTERFHREFQRQLSRRMPERNPILVSRGGSIRDHKMEE